MLCNIILTVNFVRSGLFPTGHVSLTWEHRVFVPSAEGSPEKRRACHTHHPNLLSLWPNAAGCLRVIPHPSAYRARSASPQPYSVPASDTIHRHFTNHRVWAVPPSSQAKLQAILSPAYKKLRVPHFKSDCNLRPNTLFPPVCSHGREGKSLIKPADPAPPLAPTPREMRGHKAPPHPEGWPRAPDNPAQADKGTGRPTVTAPDTAAAADGTAWPAQGQVSAQGQLSAQGQVSARTDAPQRD